MWFIAEVSYFTPLLLASVEWTPVCKVCLTCKPLSNGNQETPARAPNPGLWKNVSLGTHMATVRHSLLMSMKKISNFNCIGWLRTCLYGLSDILATDHWHSMYPHTCPNPRYMKEFVSRPSHSHRKALFAVVHENNKQFQLHWMTQNLSVWSV